MSIDKPVGPLSPRAAALNGLPIEIRVCVGHARPRLGDMLSMAPDAVLPLDSRVEDRVSLYVGERLIAVGELVELEGEDAGRLAVRVTALADRADDTA
jgi:flagellar motor switch protein FliN